MVHQAGAYPSFCSMKQLGVFPIPPLDGMLILRRVTPSIKFAGTHIYTWVERRTVRVKVPCTTQYPRSGLEPGPLAPESSALTTRPPRLPSPDIWPSVHEINIGLVGCGINGNGGGFPYDRNFNEGMKNRK